VGAFTVTAWNVEFSKSATASEIAAALVPYKPDVALFCEAPGGNWTREAADVLGLQHTVVGQYATAGHKDKYKSIAGRTPLERYEEVLMADTYHTLTRAVTKIDGTEIVFYSIHYPFGWRDQAHIDETNNKVRTFVDYLGAHQADEIAVVGGDFNYTPTRPGRVSMYHEWMLEIGLEPAWSDLGIDTTTVNTSNAFKPADEGSGKVIDHIMYDHGRVRAIDGGIIQLDPPLSDHKPVWARLELR